MLEERDEEIKSKRAFVWCACHSHMIMVQKFDDEDQIEISYWAQGDCNTRSLKNLLRQIWHIIRYGTPYGDFVILSKEEKEKLIDILKDI